MAFKKGQSGNPAGRPKGAVNTVRGELRDILDSRAIELLDAAIEQALAGDGRLLVFFLDRLLPTVDDTGDGGADLSLRVEFVKSGRTDPDLEPATTGPAH